MTIHAAVVREQGVNFAVVIVKRSVFSVPTQREEAQRQFSGVFPGMPVVLMSQDQRGTPTYWGRRDIVDFLSGVPLESIPWRKYYLN
jgi:hypothetical protein